MSQSNDWQLSSDASDETNRFNAIRKNAYGLEDHSEAEDVDHRHDVARANQESAEITSHDMAEAQLLLSSTRRLIHEEASMSEVEKLFNYNPGNLIQLLS